LGFDVAIVVVLHEISTILNTGLDRQSLSILVQLCEMGVNPGALVHGTSSVYVSALAECSLFSVVQELRRESARLKQEEEDAEALNQLAAS
jgi:hypothetical protein